MAIISVSGIINAIDNIADDLLKRDFKRLASNTQDLRNQIAALRSNLNDIDPSEESSKIVLQQFCNSIIRAFESHFIQKGIDIADIMEETQTGQLVRNLVSVATDYMKAPDVSKVSDTKANLSTTMISLVNSLNKVREIARERMYKPT